ncbi:efflux transporter outer membrane subunit [Prolixibacteraceae bacterium Z1-6]|uniref:Efflux transporter outer membrane subunit n=1 Tax=Draconibacterium aestuarii TaxID=2998507 RepID=A0A9X3J617_9BACT|nr:efflux transporter outer membrane subunit [Prolixibacteraceae bacterium Z1-6]
MRHNKTRNKLSILAILIVVASSCMVGPNFQKVKVESPEKFRFQEEITNDSLNIQWKTFFADQTLIALIDSALVNNYDARIAVSRISQARAALGMSKANMYPGITMGANGLYGNTIGGFPTGASSTTALTSNVSINWELDFWGKFRRANEAAQADLLATEYGLRAIQISLIAEVANSYYSLLDFRKRLDIANYTLETRSTSLGIIRERFEKGIAPEIDVNQAEIQEAVAAAHIPVYKRSIAFIENALSLLLGKHPQAIITNSNLENLKVPDSLPVGLPSNLLIRRPDILQAEQLLIAQNASIGIAQALRFPSLSLTGLLGIASADLSAFNMDDALIGSVGAGLFGPVFQFGKNKRRVELERERTEEMRLNYERAVIAAFRETENALVAIQTIKQELTFVQAQLKASMNAAKLSRQRYDGGVTSYLEVLEAERNLFNIELYDCELQQQQLTAYANLFKTLGGGWEAQ